MTDPLTDLGLGGGSAGRAAPSGGWRSATVTSVTHPAANAVAVRLRVPDRVDHLPGQHYVVRLRAEDGYTAQRSYSLASAPEDEDVELYVERLPDGEVSTFLADVVEVGDVLEVRGPLGGWFVWDGATPALGVAGGTGVVPIVAMLRHAVDTGTTDLLRVAVSARSLALLPYADELVAAGAVVALTRDVTGATSSRPAGRLAAADLAPLLRPGTTSFVCGSAPFAEAATGLLVDLGVPPASVRVERFGPSGAPDPVPRESPPEGLSDPASMITGVHLPARESGFRAGQPTASMTRPPSHLETS